MNFPQIKVCGLTNVKEAVGCADLGVDAIGFVFFPQSPRNVSLNQAKKISAALPDHIKTVGVFVNESYDNIMHIADYCKLKAVQLHGRESPELTHKLGMENLLVLKALFMSGTPSLNEVSHYDASAYLVECGKGDLPGGNALSWNWHGAREFGEKNPLVLAGGLSSKNIREAVYAGLPDAVDISSGVEASKGRKDLDKVARFISSVKQLRIEKALKIIF